MPSINWPIVMGVPGSLGALIALWILLGFPTLATSSDIQMTWYPKIAKPRVSLTVEQRLLKTMFFSSVQQPGFIWKSLLTLVSRGMSSEI